MHPTHREEYEEAFMPPLSPPGSISQHWEMGFIVFQAACCSAPRRNNRNYYSINGPIFLPDTCPPCSPPDRMLSQLGAGVCRLQQRHTEALRRGWEQRYLSTLPINCLYKIEGILNLTQIPSCTGLSHSPEKNLLHLLQPVHLLHSAGRGVGEGEASWGRGHPESRRLCLPLPSALALPATTQFHE